MSAVVVEGEAWTPSRNGGLKREDRAFADAASVFEGTRALSDDESVESFLLRFQHDAATRRAAEDARAFVEGFDAADPARASARAIALEWRSGVDSTLARPIGGYRPLFERMRDDCVAAGVQICLSSAVRRISWRRGSVAVDAVDSRKQSRTLTARSGVVTLPVGVLRHRGDETAVAFDPKLPPAKRDALEHIEMGHAIKVMLWFRSAFWERVSGGRYRNGAFFRSWSAEFPAYWTQWPVRSELVAAWAGGPRAIAIGGLTHAELIERAVAGFGLLFGEPKLAASELEFGIAHDWRRDPFARGAYSYLAVGGAQSRTELAKPLDGTLFFAGEATAADGEGGTVNGAFETGLRAAAELANA
jgi:monoamine oxidase